MQSMPLVSVDVQLLDFRDPVIHPPKGPPPRAKRSATGAPNDIPLNIRLLMPCLLRSNARTPRHPQAAVRGAPTRPFRMPTVIKCSGCAHERSVYEFVAVYGAGLPSSLTARSDCGALSAARKVATFA
jgi:hypothetical protein